MTIRNIGFIASGAFAAALALSMLTPPALCAEPAAPAAVVFPVGSRVGLVPPPGMVVSKTFPGFMDPEKNAGIVIRVMPPNAYPAMKKSLGDDTLKKQGLTVVKRDTMQLAVGKADLVVGNELSPDKKPFRKWLLLVPTNDLTAAVSVQAPADDSVYSDAVVRTALASLTLRAKVPDTDYLQALPFKVGDTAGFHIGNVIPGRALMLIDAPDYPHMIATNGLPEYEFNARFIVTAAPGGPSDPNQRANLARRRVQQHRWHQRQTSHDGRACAHQWPGSIRNCCIRQGCFHRRQSDGGAVAAFRRRRIFANDRRVARRDLGQGIAPVARDPRRHHV